MTSDLSTENVSAMAMAYELICQALAILDSVNSDKAQCSAAYLCMATDIIS